MADNKYDNDFLRFFSKNFGYYLQKNKLKIKEILKRLVERM